MTTAPRTTGALTLPDTLRLGAVDLVVSDLERSIGYYEDVLGLVVHDRGAANAALGAGGEDLVRLVEDAGAAPGGRHAGLFHFALLYPTRAELAHALRRLAATRTRIDGAADHGVSEALYLRDPDHHGIELYADRPRERWPPGRVDGDRFDIFTIALDVQSLLDAAPEEHPPPGPGPGLRMGHVHLHVGDIERGLEFYRDVLGFEVMANIGSAAFVSAGGYHHHLGFNTWLGPDVEPLPPHTAGLRTWTVVLEDADQVQDVRERVAAAGDPGEEREGGFVVRDPWGTAVTFATAP